MTYHLENKVVGASAGSGKTFELSNRYLRLVLSGVKTESILAATFTRKAAGEIQDRILSRLGEGACDPESALALYNALGQDFAASIGMTQENALSIFQNKLAEIVRRLQKLRISTIDSFFMQLAGGYAFEIGLPPNWHIVEELDADVILQNALLSSFAQTTTENAHTLARLLFKGEFKRTIADEIKSQVTNNLSIYYDTERKPNAWMRLRPQVDSELSDWDSIVASLSVAREKAQAADKRMLKALDTSVDFVLRKDWLQFLKASFTQKIVQGATKYYRANIPDEVLSVMSEFLKHAQKNSVEDLSNQTLSLWGALDAVSRYFDRAKFQKGAYRFDDLAIALRERSLGNQTDRLFYRMDSQTSHILLDEFQDASFTQWAVIRPFAESIIKNPSGSFYCVGDVKQAIYGWRGGKAEIFDAIGTDLSNVVSDTLSTNWRSSKIILDVVNELFNKDNLVKISRGDNEEQDGPSPFEQAAKKWAEGFEEHKCAPKNENLAGYWALEQAPSVDENGYTIDPRLDPIDPKDFTDRQEEKERLANSGSLVRVEQDGIPEDDEDVQNKSKANELQKKATLQYIVERIAKLYEECPDATIGVLPRTNAFIGKLTRKLKERFNGTNVEISEEGGSPIYDSPAVDAVLSVLKMATHTGDSVSRFHVANIAPLSQKFDLTPKNYDYKYKAQNLSKWIRKAIDVVGLGKYVSELRDLLLPICAVERDKERLDKLVEFAYSYQATTDRLLLDRFIQAVQAYKAESPSGAKIRVMSLHKSKGLQFDVVVLPELEKQIDRTQGNALCVHYEDFKSPVKIDGVTKYVSKDVLANFDEDARGWISEAIKEQATGEIQEALNLLYVGLTRPVRALIAIVSPQKPNRLTFSKILRKGLHVEDSCSSPNAKGQEDLHARILFKRGDPDWRLSWKRAPEAQTFDDESLRVPIVNYTLPEGMRSRRLLFHRETPTENHVSREWNAESGAAMRRGTALHACFEAIRWLDLDGVPSDEKLRETISPILFDADLVNATIAEFKEMCANDFIRRLLSSSSYEGKCEVQQEREFSIVRRRKGPKDDLIRGTIDRLVLSYDGDKIVAADVIDYKSNKYLSGQTYEQYDEQLKEYGKAVQTLFLVSPEKIKMRYVFVGKDWPDDQREHLVGSKR